MKTEAIKIEETKNLINWLDQHESLIKSLDNYNSSWLETIKASRLKLKINQNGKVQTVTNTNLFKEKIK